MLTLKNFFLDIKHSDSKVILLYRFHVIIILVNLIALIIDFMAILLYLEYLNNPSNPLVQNPQALFNLAYTTLIIFIFGLLYHFSIAKTFDELDSSNRQKEMLLSEVHHRVKNNLNVIASIIGLQANTLQESEKEQMSLEVMIQLGIIANELLTNSIKYAFENAKGIITIKLDHQNEKYHFIYSDNGIGSDNPQELLESKSLGIKLIHLAARQLSGSVTLTSPQGLHYKIEFKNE